MKEVDKLYKNAGLTGMWVEEYDDKQFWHGCYTEMIQSMMKLNDWDRKTATSIAHKECRKAVPPFTPYKQMQLLLLTLNKTKVLNIEIIDGPYITMPTLVEGIAMNVNSLWDYFSDEEKDKVREILRCAE